MNLVMSRLVPTIQSFLMLTMVTIVTSHEPVNLTHHPYRTITVPLSTQFLVPSGRISIITNFVWHESSNITLAASVKRFKYKHKFLSSNIDFLIPHITSLIGESRFDQAIQIINYSGDLAVTNVESTTIWECTFTYLHNADQKVHMYSFQYSDSLFEAVSNIREIIAKATSNLVSLYSKSVQTDIMNTLQVQKFRSMTAMYLPSLPHATLNELVSSRFDILAYVATTYPHYTKYLEIGTDDNVLFSAMSTDFFPTYAVGVDPNKGGTLRMTSDAYFESSNDDFFDVVFIDGLHEAYQVYRDILNALRILRPGGIILVHDCNPPDELTGAYPRPAVLAQSRWNGDTWKAIVAIRAVRDDLDVVTIDTDQGIAVIRKIDPNSSNIESTTKNTIRKQLSDEWKKLLDVHPMHILNYKDHLESHRVELLNLVTIQEFEYWLTSSSSSVSSLLAHPSPILASVTVEASGVI